MSGVIAGVSSAIELVKKLSEIAQKTKDADLKNLIADLRLQLAELKTELAKVVEENVSLREQVARKTAATSTELEVRDGVYWSGSDGPYCTGCVDNKQKRILLQELQGSFRHFGRWKCPVCNATMGKSSR